MSAETNPLTAKPGTKLLARIIRKALITKVKRPKVKIVKGRVKKISIGFRIAFIIPRTTATTIAVKKLSTDTPGRI